MGWFSDFFRAKPQPQLSQHPNIDRVIVHMTWRTPEQMAVEYPGKLGVTRGPMLLGDGEYHAYITASEPQDFNDTQRLEVLGHELFHALGARHD